MNHARGTMFCGLILVVLGFPVSTGAADLPESAAARVRWFDEIVDLSRPTDILVPRVISSPGGADTEVRIDSQLGNRYHIFLPHRSPPADLASPGTVIIRQRDSDGAIDQMKVFLQHDEGTFFRLRPRSSRRSLEMDLYLAGREWYRDVTVPISLERAVRAPISEIQDLTAGIVDWDVVRPQFDRAEYGAIADIVRRIRAQLPQLSDADDGAMDADGSYVSIESLELLDEERGFNCSGFAKWIVDGLYQPLTGTLMPVDTLREKHLDHRGTRWSRRVEETRDPYFGLDWTRNLAREIHAV
ncbi:MAG TPA: hypothetical protein VJ932_07435, partial [Alkalispirochaeta sp.]|nr:hypothetical protein [Alkalispirochaeta sp.]